MRVFRFVLSVALLAAVCAEVAPEIQEGLNTASDIVDKVAPLVTPQDTTPTANTAATPEAPLDASDIAGTTATVINQVANSDLVKESDVSDCQRVYVTWSRGGAVLCGTLDPSS